MIWEAARRASQLIDVFYCPRQVTLSNYWGCDTEGSRQQCRSLPARHVLLQGPAGARGVYHSRGSPAGDDGGREEGQVREGPRQQCQYRGERQGSVSVPSVPISNSRLIRIASNYSTEGLRRRVPVPGDRFRKCPDRDAERRHPRRRLSFYVKPGVSPSHPPRLCLRTTSTSTSSSATFHADRASLRMA